MSHGVRVAPFRRGLPVAALAASTLLWIGVEVGPGPALVGAGTPSTVVVDRERGAVQIACLFVNPSRVLEVFACHDSGPAHETVVSFLATGPEIQAALLAIGCRPASYWNASSPGDFAKNQGDRVLVSLRWRQEGEWVDAAAEAMLLDAHEDERGLPAFIRGFSFAGTSSSGSAASPSDSAPAIPEGVEITLGATKRESPSHIILGHPTNTTRLANWVVPPALDSAVVPDLRKLVDSQTPATLVLKRVRSEVEIVERARRRAKAREWPKRLRLLDSIEPMAQEIDRLKKAYEDLAQELRGWLEEPSEGRQDADGARARVLPALRRLQWLGAQIEERYLSIYAQQEAHKLAWLRTQKDFSFDVRDEAEVFGRFGVPIELELVRKEVELAALRVSAGTELSATDSYEVKTIASEMQDLERRRELGLADATLKYYRHRLATSVNEYQREIFKEDVQKAEALLELAAAKQAEQWTKTAENRHRRDGRWEGRAAEVLRQRSAAVRARELGEVGVSRVRLLSQMRWTRQDLEDQNPARSARAGRELKRLEGEMAELEKRRAKLLDER